MLAHLLGDLLREPGTTVVHRQDDRRQMDRRIQVLLNHPDAAEQLAEALECVVLALDGDHQLAGGREGIDREQTERRGAVDEDVIQPLRRCREVLLECGA